ncbi:MAG TPA: ABC transporter permease [Streptosporangiaceae bacterium]|nr:ABC transporter permease [Streptosporangiaceae bacterium]
MSAPAPVDPAPADTARQEEHHAERTAPSAILRVGLQRYAILIVFAIMVAVFGADLPSTFLSIENLSNILGSQAPLFILVMAVLLPTVVGDFVDLSLGSSLGLSAMTLAVLNVQHHTPVLVACLAGIGAAMIVGLINVFFVVFFDSDPFIVTLGTMTVVQGVIYIVSGSNSVGIVSTNLSNWIFTNEFLSIPLEFYYGLAIFLVVWYVLSFTPTGQKALVIGQSREVARLSGIRVNRQRSWAYIIGAAIAGVAGIAYAGTNGTVDPTAGSSLILPAYAAVFLGATAIKPGRINPLGALIAVYFLAAGTAGLELLGAQTYFQQIFYGVALVASITIPKVNRERFFRKRRVAS